MDYYNKLEYPELFARQNTPSTNYSLYSSPPTSPVNFLYMSQVENMNSRNKSLIKVFENLSQRYFLLNSEKNRVNQSCIELIHREKALESRQRTTFSILQEDFNGEYQEKSIKKLEKQNLDDRKELENLIKEYFCRTETLKCVGLLLKEIVDRNEVVEKFKNKFLSLRMEVVKLNSEKGRLRLEQEKVQEEKNRLLEVKRQTIEEKKKAQLEEHKVKNQTIQVSTTENVAAYLISQSHFTHSDYSALKSSLSEKQDSIQKIQNSIRQLNSQILSKHNLLSQKKQFLKSFQNSMNEKKSSINCLKSELLIKQSQNNDKESYLSKEESHIHRQYKILENLTKNM